MNNKDTILLKRKLKDIKSYKGEGTQLISLYLPPNADRSSVTTQLTDEMSQSSNIKSQHTRKNVQAALKRITNYLRQIDFKLPKNGLILFSGNVSENPSKTDIILLALQPPKTLTTKLYWCDSSFHTAPLEELVETDEVYGIISIDKREATIAVLNGKSYKVIKHETSAVPGKTRAGGQCLKDCIVQLKDGTLEDIENCKSKSNIVSIFKNNNYNNSSSTIKDVWKVNKNKIYKIITKEPRFELECSGGHTLFVNDLGNIIEKKVKDLKKSDQLIFPEIINFKGKTQNLNIKSNYNSLFLYLEGRKKLIQKRLSKNYTQKQLAKSIGVTQSAISSLELGKRNPSNKFLKAVCKKLNINYDGFIQKYTSKTDIENIKLPSKLDPIFAQFIGYFIGDGSIERDRISFFEQDKALALYYKQKFDNYLNIKSSFRLRDSKNYYELRFTSRPLIRFIKSNFPEIKYSTDSRTPKLICKSSKKVIASFLKGLYDAEGYVHRTRKSTDISINNKKLAQEIQLLLLRFSIISSFLEYDNRKNKFSNNPRFTISITDKKSLDLFSKNIGFSLKRKKEDLKKILKLKSNKSNNRQIFCSGKQIKNLILSSGLELKDFYKINSFLNNNRQISKFFFKKNLLDKVNKNSKIYSKLLNIYNFPILPVKIKEINVISKKSLMTDVSVKEGNFLANGLMVHNSAHRFERLREKAAQDFFKRVGEVVNSIFVPKEKLKGIIIGGPGNTKNDFLDHAKLDHRIKDKVIGKVDTCYTDESGIKEILDKSEEILKDLSIIKERKLVNELLAQVSKNALGTYGFNDTINAIKLGQAETVLVSEDLNYTILKFQCTSCKEIIPHLVKHKSDIKKVEKSLEKKCPNCSKKTELIEQVDFFDFIIDYAQPMGSRVELISTETQEGKQFLETFGGIAALLRYK